MSSVYSTCKLPIQGSNSMCILNSEWTCDEVKVLLLHSSEAWTGKFQVQEDECISELIDQLSLSKEEFIDQTRNALTTHGGAKNFSYVIENDTFIWKKYVKANMAVKYGHINLLQVPLFNVFEKIIDNILHSNIEMGKKIDYSNEQRETLEKENKILMDKLNSLTAKKSEMETMLYSQFLCLLNEKKKCIEEIKNEKESTCDDEYKTDSPKRDSDYPISDADETCDKNSSLDIEDKNFYTLPKRTRKTRSVPTKDETKINNRNFNSSNELMLAKSKDLSVFPRKISEDNVGKIKTEKDSCDTNEEDAFTFTKRTEKGNKKIKSLPSTSKVKCESDDDTYMDKTMLLDTVMITNDGKTDETTVKEVNNFKVTKEEDTHKNSNEKKISEETLGNSVSKGFSSSTLSMLNQLI